MEMENCYSSPIPRIEKGVGNPMKRALPFQEKVIGITGISGQKDIRTAHASPTGLKFIHNNVYVNHWKLYIEKGEPYEDIF